MDDWAKIEAYQRGAAFMHLKRRMDQIAILRNPLAKGVPTARDVWDEAFRCAGLEPPPFCSEGP
jgi:hypothetical protein